MLLANAGLQVYDRRWTDDGFELTFGANHLGHLALIEQLVDVLEPPATIVVTASGTHDADRFTGIPSPLPIDARALAFPPQRRAGWRDGTRRYATSKLANVMTAYALARRLADRAITVNAFDPGLMPGTGLAREAPAPVRGLFQALARGLLVLPGVNTAATSGVDLAHLATAPPLAGVTGRYVVRRAPAPSSRASIDVATQEALYRDSLALLAEARLDIHRATS